MASNYGIKRKKAPTLRGFSLTEMAIVLAVIGLVLGAIWGVVSTVRQNMKREQTVNQVVVAARNIRDFFLAKGIVQAADGSGAVQNLTSYLLENGVLLPEQIRDREAGTGNYIADHPLMEESVSKGSFQICSKGNKGVSCEATDGSSEFAVRLLGLKKADCAALAPKLASPSGPPGLISLYLNESATAEELPLTEEDALDGCSKETENIIVLVYRLRVPR